MKQESIDSDITVLFCQPTMNDSGSENSLAEIIEGLKQFAPGIKLTVLTGAAGPMLTRIGLHADVHVVASPKLTRSLASVLPHVFSYLRVFRAIRRARTNNKGFIIVYVNSLMFPPAVVGAWLNRIPLIVHVREVSSTYPKLVYFAYFGLSALLANRMLGVCAYIFRQHGVGLIRKLCGIEYNVIHNGADCNTKMAKYTADGKTRILAVIPLTPRKGALELMQFVVELKAINPHIRFVLDVVGRIEDCKFYARCREVLGKHSCEELVRFRGAQSREVIDEYYSKAHIFVHPSHTEAFPRVLVEAMNHSLPCITTNAGGSAEAVEDGVTGYVVEVGDYQAMADRVGRLISDAELYALFSANAYALYQSQFTRQVMAKKVLDALDCVRVRHKAK